LPLEEVDRELADLFMQICRGQLAARVRHYADEKHPRVFRLNRPCGQVVEEIFIPLPKRNDPCFCGSGRKYKKCCG